MNFVINDINFNCSTGKIQFYFENPIQETITLSLCERKAGFGEKLFIPKKIILPIDHREHGLCSVDIDVSEIEEQLICNSIWDFTVHVPSTKEFFLLIFSGEIKEIEEQYYENNEKQYYIKPYKTVKDNLAIFVKNTNFYTAEKIKDSKEKLLLKIHEEIYSKNKKAILRLKKRVNRLSKVYNNHYINFPIENQQVILSKTNFERIKFEASDVFDGYIIFNPNTDYEHEFQLKHTEDPSQIKRIDFNCGWSCFSSGGFFSIYINPLSKFDLLSIDNDENNLVLQIEVSSPGKILAIDSIELLGTNDTFYLDNGFEIRDFEYKILEKQILLVIPQKNINLKQLKKWIVYINYKTEDGNIRKIYLRCENDFLNNNKVTENNLLIEQGFRKEAIFSPFNQKEIDMDLKVRIAVLGSCYSRAAFTQSDYFNYDYKQKYEVVYTQFHTGLISLVNEKKCIFPRNLFKNIDERIQNYVSNDFKKNFFTELERAHPDYLIIDLYVDAQKGVIYLENGTIITGNIYVEDSDFIKILSEKDKILLPREHDYFKKWSIAADEFVVKILKIMREDQIILNFVNASEKYKNEKGEIQVFQKEISKIKFSNLLIDKQMNYLHNLLPNAQIIDSRYWSYIADSQHPQGLSFNHLETNYYKEYMRQVDKLILKSLLKEKLR